MTKICLFTAHSPMGGGGGVIIRSLIENLSNISFDWKYTANLPVKEYQKGYLGKSLMGGAIVKDMWNTWGLLTEKPNNDVSLLVRKMMEVECDAYWIISHNEGLRLAIELARVDTTRPVHLTIHDDWAGAICKRSSRYKVMSRAAKKLTISGLQQVSSFDVISKGMQKYYKEISGKTGSICHRYLSENQIYTHSNLYEDSDPILYAGHIGSIYDKGDFISFLNLLHAFFEHTGKKIKLQLWGSHIVKDDIPLSLQEYTQLHDGLSEEKIIPKLAACIFVYAMYPMSAPLQLFSKTSLPTKLSSYVQAGRPILGHALPDSTLAEFLNKSKTGLLWKNKSLSEGIKILENICAMKVPAQLWEYARKEYFGEKNLQTINGHLIKKKNSPEIQ